jgi:hypothetical protein
MSTPRHARVKRHGGVLDLVTSLAHLFSGLAMDVQRFLIGLGLIILIAGIAWPLLSRIGLGRLPGDIIVQRGHMTFFFPLVTCLVVSVVLSAVFWLLNR